MWTITFLFRKSINQRDSDINAMWGVARSVFAKVSVKCVLKQCFLCFLLDSIAASLFENNWLMTRFNYHYWYWGKVPCLNVCSLLTCGASMAQLAVLADTQDTISKQVYKHILSYGPVSLFVYLCTANCHQHFEVKEDKHCFQVILWKEMVSSSYIWLHIPSSYGPWPDESPAKWVFFLHDIYFISIFFKVFYKKRGVVKNGQLFVIFFAVFVPYITIIGALKRILQKEKVIFTQLLGSPIPPILLLCHNMVGERYSIRVKSYEGHGKCIFETPHNDMKCVLSCN